MLSGRLFSYLKKKKKKKLGEIVTRCHSLSFVVTCCHSLYHSLSFVVTRCTNCCHSLSFVHLLYQSLSFVVICCHSFYHSLSLAVTRCTTRLFFINNPFSALFSLSLTGRLIGTCFRTCFWLEIKIMCCEFMYWAAKYRKITISAGVILSCRMIIGLWRENRFSN